MVERQSYTLMVSRFKSWSAHIQMEEISIIDTLSSPNLSEPLNVKKGISEKQIKQLIDYAKSDEEVGKFTSDKKRFPNREAYDIWINLYNPVIYILVNEQEKL